MTAIQITDTEIVADPVGLISISGVHGRDELDDRLANSQAFRKAGSPLKPLLLGAAIGAVVTYLLKR